MMSVSHLSPYSFVLPMHRVCVGLHYVLQAHVFGLRELVLSDRPASDVCILFGGALVELLLFDAAAGVFANIDFTRLSFAGAEVWMSRAVVECEMLSKN